MQPKKMGNETNSSSSEKIGSEENSTLTSSPPSNSVINNINNNNNNNNGFLKNSGSSSSSSSEVSSISTSSPSLPSFSSLSNLHSPQMLSPRTNRAEQVTSPRGGGVWGAENVSVVSTGVGAVGVGGVGLGGVGLGGGATEEKKKAISELTFAFLEIKRLELKTTIANAEKDVYKSEEVELLKKISLLYKQKGQLEGQQKINEKTLREFELQTINLGQQLAKTFEFLQFQVSNLRERNLAPAMRLLEALYKKMINGEAEVSPQVTDFIHCFREILPPLELSLHTKTLLTEQHSLLESKVKELETETEELLKMVEASSVRIFFSLRLISYLISYLTLSFSSSNILSNLDI